MRLIDADTLISALSKRYNEKSAIVPNNLADGFVQVEKLIKEQPTAYDVDKVVHRLNSEYDNCVTIDMGAYNYGIDKAIRIVKEQLEG